MRKQNGARVKRAAEKAEAERHKLKQEIDQTAARTSGHTAQAEARMAKPTADRADGQAMIAKLANDKAPTRDQLIVDKAEPAPEPPGWSFSALALVGYAAFAGMWRNGWPLKRPNENAASGVDAAKATSVQRKVEREGAEAADRTDTYLHLAATWPWKLRGTRPPFLAALKEIPRTQAAEILFWAFGAVASLWFMLCIMFRIGGDTRPHYFMTGVVGAALLWGSGWLVRAFLLGRHEFRPSDLSHSPAATEPHCDEPERSRSKPRVKQTTKRSMAVSNAKRRRHRASPQGQEPATGKPASRARKNPAKRQI